MFKVIDTHVHPIQAAIDSQTILDEMKSNNVEKAVILGMDLHSETLDNPKWRRNFEKQLQFMLVDQEQIIETMRFILENGHTSNQYVSNLQNDFPNKFIGLGSVQIGYQKKSYIQNKLKEIVELNLKGIKLLPTLQFYNPKESKRLEELFKFAEKHDLITLLHTGCDPGPWEFPILSRYGNPELLAPILGKFPNVPIILAHLGSYSAKAPAIWFKETLKLFEDFPDNKLYGDISAVPYLLEKEFYFDKIKKFIGFDKILYGSDFPVTFASMNESLLPITTNPLLSSIEKQKILYENATRLFFK